MRELLSKEDKEGVEFIFRYALRHSEDLNEWQLNTLASIESQYKGDGMLSKPQVALVFRIFEEMR